MSSFRKPKNKDYEGYSQRKSDPNRMELVFHQVDLDMQNSKGSLDKVSGVLVLPQLVSNRNSQSRSKLYSFESKSLSPTISMSKLFKNDFVNPNVMPI